MRKLAFLIFALSLPACSIYQSDGRKYLEQNAYQFAGVSATAAQPNFQGCQDESAAAPWVEQSETADAKIFENDGFRLRIQPADATAFSCDYLFASAQELVEKTDSAVALTLAKYKELSGL